MTSSPGPESPAPIVVGVDGTEDGFAAVRYALAEARQTQAPVLLLQVVPQIGPVSPLSVLVGDIAMEEGRGRLEDVAARAHAIAPELRIEQRLVFGPRNAELVSAAEDATMLVLGCRAHRPFRLGSTGATAAAVAALASCPVRIVPPHWHQPEQAGAVVVAVKGAEAEAVIRRGAQIARRTGAPLTVVHVRTDPTAEPDDLPAQVEIRDWTDAASVLAGYDPALLILGQPVDPGPFRHVGRTTRALLSRLDRPIEVCPVQEVPADTIRTRTPAARRPDW